MESEVNTYRLNQGNKEYILTISIIGDAIRIVCTNISNKKIRFSRDFTVNELKKIDHVFDFIQNTYQALIYIDKALKNQKVGISEEGEALKINFYLNHRGISHQLEIPLGNKGFMASGFNDAFGSWDIKNAQFTQTTNANDFEMNQNQNMGLSQNPAFGQVNSFNESIPIIGPVSDNDNNKMTQLNANTGFDNNIFTQANTVDNNAFNFSGTNQGYGDLQTTSTQQFATGENDQINQLLKNIPGMDFNSGNSAFTQAQTITNTTTNANNQFFSPPVIGPVNDSSNSNDFLQNLKNNQFNAGLNQNITSQFKVDSPGINQDITSQFKVDSTGINQDISSQFKVDSTGINQDITSQFGTGKNQEITSQINHNPSFPETTTQFTGAIQDTTTQFTAPFNMPPNFNEGEKQLINQQTTEINNQMMDNNIQSNTGFDSTNILKDKNQSNFAPKGLTEFSFGQIQNNLETGDIQNQTDLLNQMNEPNTNFNNNFPMNFTETQTKTQYDFQLKNVPKSQNIPQSVIQPQMNLPMQSIIPAQNVPDERINKLEGDTNSLRNEHHFMQDKINALTGEMNAYKSKLELMEKEKAEREINALKAENQAIKKQLSELKNLKNDSEEVRFLRSQLSEMDSIKRKLEEMEVLKGQFSELKSLREKVNKLSGVKSQLGELNNLRQQVSQMSLLKSQIGEINNLRTKVDELSGVKSQLEELNNLRAQMKQMNSLKQQINELNNLKNTIVEGENLRNKLNELENINIQYEKEIKSLRNTQNKNGFSEFQKITETKLRSTSGMDSKQLLFEDRPQQICVKGDIIHNTDELELVTRKINKLNQKLTLNLLYKATADSDKAEAFHARCDDAKSSLVLVETDKGRRFGGYTTCSWSGDCEDKKDEDAFIFSLDKMMTYDNIPGEDAIGCYPKFGPIFLGCQIRIYDNAFSKGGTTFEKGLNFNTEEDYELTGGEREFNVREIEVYEVIQE